MWVGLFWFEIFGGQVLISLHCTRFRVLFYFTSIVTFVLVLRSLWRTFHSDAFECGYHLCLGCSKTKEHSRTAI